MNVFTRRLEIPPEVSSSSGSKEFPSSARRWKPPGLIIQPFQGCYISFFTICLRISYGAIDINPLSGILVGIPTIRRFFYRFEGLGLQLPNPVSRQRLQG